ncbi:MAG TPA: DUF2249 domain-containing protein [Ktedonobacterales bacterium]|nr:DUF2249 domain-containing protein [Ktedonobacterales bacterium]
MSSKTAHELTDAIRTHHRSLAETLDGYAADVEASAANPDSASLADLLDRLTTFLSGDLLPHAQGEERTLYPALDPIIREHGSPTATMSVDHEYLGEYARKITETAQALRAASARERAELARQLDRQVLLLQGLFTVHLAKEERVYLPLVEQAVSSEDQHTLLAALHEEAEGATAHGAPEADALDVRSLPPARRHPVIFGRFEALALGESFILVNDHDPKPLYYQLVAEYPGQLLWEYVEQGPEVWRVRVGKAN